MTRLEEFENMWRSMGSSSAAPTRENIQRRLEHGEHNVRREIRQLAARRRFIYNATVNPPDEATWARARARRVEELRNDLLEAVARQFDDSPFEAESILSDSEATELKERLVFQEGAAFVLDLLRRTFPREHLLGNEAGVHGGTDR